MKTENKTISIVFLICILVFFWTACGKPDTETKQEITPPDIEDLKAQLDLQTETDPDTNARASRGTFTVYEDRDAQKGRKIKLDVVILHATGPEPKPDPLFVFAGGPGGDVTGYTRGYEESWVREERDVVFVSQRGTGGDNRIDCEIAASDDDLQGYFDPLFNIDHFKACLEDLQKIFDLTKYSTCLAADDINDIRLALGYDKINITGGSYGTRMSLVYMRRHPETVRTAILNGVAPISFKNPLFHAPAAHEAIRLLMAECANDPDCNGAYPNLEDEFHAILDRLEKEPADTFVTHPTTDERVPIKLTKAAFVEALRMMMYSSVRTLHVPDRIHKAFLGDYEPFAQLGMTSNRGVRQLLALGMLLCVTCAEDLDRISEEEIVEITGGTYLGDDRVRQQKAVCEIWPRSDIPESYGDPVSVEVPVLLLSGTLDPVTPPRFGEAAAKHLPNSLHLVVPGAHGVGGACLTEIRKQFIESGSVEGLDISCTKDLKKLKFQVQK
jgi:pimeloyl-ACP methyl ester carboxylesterase